MFTYKITRLLNFGLVYNIAEKLSGVNWSGVERVGWVELSGVGWGVGQSE